MLGASRTTATMHACQICFLKTMYVAVASSEARVAPMRSSRNLEWLDAQLDAHRAEEHAQLAAEARRASPTLALADAKRILECYLGIQAWQKKLRRHRVPYSGLINQGRLSWRACNHD